MNHLKTIAFSLIGLSLLLVLSKFVFWDYTFSRILPKNKYEVYLNVQAEGVDQAISIATFLPQSNEHQVISNELSTNPNFNFNVEQSNYGRETTWKDSQVDGKVNINYSFDYIGKAFRVEIDSNLKGSKNFPPSFKKYLKGSKYIQVGHPKIQEIYTDEIGEVDLVT